LDRRCSRHKETPVPNGTGAKSFVKNRDDDVQSISRFPVLGDSFNLRIGVAIMARKPIRRGPRAAPGTAPAGGEDDINIVVGEKPVLFSEGSYDIAVAGARVIPHKSGARSVELTLQESNSGDYLDMDRMMVHSPGGASRQTRHNVAMLTDLADLEEGTEVTLSSLVDKLSQGDIRAEVTIYVSTDMDGKPCNKLASVDAIITDEE
jgi:hypothetical protein